MTKAFNNLTAYILATRYFRLVDKYHTWQYRYDSDSDKMQELSKKIDRLLIKIRLINPSFPKL